MSKPKLLSLHREETLFKGTYGWKNQFSLKASKMLQIRSEARTYKWNVKNG